VVSFSTAMGKALLQGENKKKLVQDGKFMCPHRGPTAIIHLRYFCAACANDVDQRT
jgi:hypothetical protein